MSAAVAVPWSVETSPRLTARITAVVFLLTSLTGIFAEVFVSGRLVVPGDAAATAINIVNHRDLFQLGFKVYLIEMALNVTLTALFYDLLKPVSHSMSLIAAFLGLAGCTIKTVGRLFYIAPAFVLGGSHYLNVFSSEQLHSLALLFLRINDQGAGIALAFFGFATLLQGYLIFRSTFLPKWLGILSMLGGVGWLTFLSPTLGLRLFNYLAIVGLLGTIAMIFWLLVFGVNEQRWRKKAEAAGSFI